jgi:YhgE/Pip-like protein
MQSSEEHAVATESDTDVCGTTDTAGAGQDPEAGASGVGTTEAGSAPSMPVRARMVLRTRSVWIFPLAIPLVLVVLMTFIYIGAVLNPTGRLDGLPVMVVNQDTGATVNGRHVDEGATVVQALNSSSEVSTKLKLRSTTLDEAKAAMDRGSAYATIVIPAGFTDSLLAAAGDDIPAPNGGSGQPTVELLENGRLGSLGVNLAAGVLTPAFQQISSSIGDQLVAHSTTAARSTSFATAQLHDPIRFETVGYRPLPPNTALGLSAFYVSLLAMLAGFVGATIVNSSLDGALGYSTTELGPRWKQRRPLPIARQQILLLKWSVALVAIPILDAAIVGVAAGILRMDAPNTALLWAVLSLASLMVASVTLTLFAAFGSIGQLLAMLGLIYLSLASSGGTVPTQALPGFYNFVGHVEPLRQVLTAARAVLYFGARGDAGLTHALIVLSFEIVAAVVAGLLITGWYDHKRLYRLSPDLIAYVSRVTDERLAATHPPATRSSS